MPNVGSKYGNSTNLKVFHRFALSSFAYSIKSDGIEFKADNINNIVYGINIHKSTNATAQIAVLLLASIIISQQAALNASLFAAFQKIYAFISK